MDAVWRSILKVCGMCSTTVNKIKHTCLMWRHLKSILFGGLQEQSWEALLLFNREKKCSLV